MEVLLNWELFYSKLSGICGPQLFKFSFRLRLVTSWTVVFWTRKKIQSEQQQKQQQQIQYAILYRQCNDFMHLSYLRLIFLAHFSPFARDKISYSVKPQRWKNFIEHNLNLR